MFYKPEDDPKGLKHVVLLIVHNFTSYCCVRRTINNIVILAQRDGTPTIYVLLSCLMNMVAGLNRKRQNPNLGDEISH